MISLCMIVKNEENYISNCLKSVIEYVDEVIVVDTGSTDSTLEICKKFGATIYNYQLNNDFSQARNFCLSKAKNDYILILDADEYIDKESAEKLRDCVKYMKYNGLKGMYLTHYNYFHTGGWSEGAHLRLVANDKMIKYSGKVYETIKVDKSKLYH